MSRVVCDPDPTGPAGLSCRLERFAGGGSASPVDGMPATEAWLPGQGRIGIAGAEELHVCGSSDVWKVDAGGLLRRVAGTGTPGYSGDGGPAVLAKLWSPHDIAGDAAGNLYVADTGNMAVRRIDPDGTIATVVGG